MAHQLIHTEAIVLASRDWREADRVFSLLTRDLGLVEARASGIRRERSRLRYHLQPYQYLAVTVVLGRRARVVAARRLASGSELISSPPAFALWMRVCHFLERFTKGQFRDPLLFQILRGGLNFLVTGRLELRQLPQFEMVLLLRLLSQLGYIEADPRYASLATGIGWDPGFVNLSIEVQNAIVGAINQALEASHL